MQCEPLPARIYDQEGNLQPFPIKDTPENRLFAEWLRVHDRYTPREFQPTQEEE